MHTLTQLGKSTGFAVLHCAILLVGGLVQAQPINPTNSGFAAPSLPIPALQPSTGLRAGGVPSASTASASAASANPATPSPGELMAQTNQFSSSVVQSSVSVQAPVAKSAAVQAPEEIEVRTEGAVAQFGAHKATFAPNAGAEVPVELQIPGLANKKPLKIRLFGLCYYDPSDGKTILLTGVQNSEGELLPPNRVIYREAIEGADLVYTYTRSSFEQDIILRKQLPDPHALGFNPRTVRLAVVSELLDPPEPRRVPNRIDLRAKNRELGIIEGGEDSLPDEVLWFGSMRMLAGRAFTLGNSGVAVPSGKALFIIEGRHFIFEFTPYSLLKAQIDALPKGTLHAKVESMKSFESMLASNNGPKTKTAAAKKMEVAQAPVDAQPGVVLDYIIVSSPLLNVNFGSTSDTKIGLAAVGQATNDYWNGYFFPGSSLSSISHLINSDGSISSAGMTVANAPGTYGGFCTDPMYNSYAYGSTNIYVTISNLPSNRYHIYLYGHDGDPGHNGIYELSRAGTVLGRKGTGTIDPTDVSTNWEPGQQYVVFENIAVTNQVLTINVIPNSIGYPYLNGMQIVPSDAVPSDYPGITNLINVNFAADSNTKVGLAAVGQSTNDFWNGYTLFGQTAGNVPVLTNAARAATSAGITVFNAPGGYGGFNTDGMYNWYVYPGDSGNITVLLTNLPEGNYDFFLYGHSGAYYDNTTFQLWMGGKNCWVKATSTYGTAWSTTNWDEGEQYVRFRDIAVQPGQPVTIVAAHDSAGYANLNGMQIVYKGPWDIDHNGLPDVWERSHFGHIGVDPSADPDGDGLNNLAEYLAGTDPNNPDSNGDGIADGNDCEFVWLEDATPAGSYEAAENESWDWVSWWSDGDGWNGNTVGAYSGSYMHMSDLYMDDVHQHYFYSPLINVRANTNDVLYAYVNLDSTYPPDEIMLQWYVTDENGNGSWEHRAYWGANTIDAGTDGTESRRYVGPLPDAGNWVRLEVPASMVGLEGKVLQGMSFTLWSGRAAWDRAGKCTFVAPAIIGQPVSQNVPLGGNATFSVVTTGTTPLSYQWRLNGTNIAGATAASLGLSNVQFAQAGSYSVQVTNRAGQAVSANAIFTVLGPPSITTQPLSQSAVQGSNVTFTVGAVGTQPLHFQWNLNGTNIPHALGNSFTKPGVRAQDVGDYAVTVTNLYGRVTSSLAHLTVNVPPSITTQPARQAACINGSVTFMVSASGTSPLSYQWRKNGANISAATGSSYSRSSLSTNDTALYSVVVTNVAGSITSSIASLFVGQGIPTGLVTLLTNGTQATVNLSSSQAGQFVSSVTNSLVYTTNPAAYTVNVSTQSTYADSIFGQAAGCANSVSLGLNVTKLPVPVISPAGAYFNYPSNVVISLGQEDLSTLISGLYRTELARVCNSTELANTLTTAQGLRASGYSDEDVRTNLIYALRTSSEYISKFGGPGQPYLANTNYFIEYSLDRGTNWTVYSGPVPVPSSLTLQARAIKFGSFDKRTLYGYLNSDIAEASFSYIPAAWLVQYFGTDYTNLALTGPYDDFDGDHVSNLEEYQHGTDPKDPSNSASVGNYIQVSAATNLYNVDLATGSYSASGTAAVGFSSSDSWNYYYSFLADSYFQNGLQLNDAANNSTDVRLWAFTGPFWPKAHPVCTEWTSSNWGTYWSCWVPWLGDYSYQPGCWTYGTSYFPSWVNNMGSLYARLPQPDWWTWAWFPLPDSSRVPTWMPAFDQGGSVAGASAPGGVSSVANDVLSCSAQQNLLEWLDYCGFEYWDNSQLYPSDWWPGSYGKSVPAARLYITGLPPGTYQVYLYEASPARVNGQAGVPMSWRTGSSGVSVPCTRFVTTPRIPGDDWLGGYVHLVQTLHNSDVFPTVNYTNRPLWVSYLESDIEIVFQGEASLAGVQIVRLSSETNPPPVLAAPLPSAVPGEASVQLSWPPVASATGYQIYRSQSAESNFVLAATTAGFSYADTRLLPSATYYYYVVATNAVTASAPSSPTLAVQTLAQTNVAPPLVYNPGDSSPFITTNPPAENFNLPPELNEIQPIRLTADQSKGFTIPFVKVLAASDAWDPDGDPISFKINSALNGPLLINGVPFDPVTNATFNAQAVVYWTPYVDVPAAGLDALDVSAFDGTQTSAIPATVTIIPVPQTYLLGWGWDLKGSLGDGKDNIDRTSYWTERYESGVAQLSPVRVKNTGAVVAARGSMNLLSAGVGVDGSLWMWGEEGGSGCFGEGQPSASDTNRHGYYSYGDVYRTLPFKVQMFGPDGHTMYNFTNVVDVSLDPYTKTVFALRTDGSLWSWGAADNGGLGRAVDDQDVLPYPTLCSRPTKKAAQVTGFTNLVGQEMSVVQVVAGHQSGMALCEDSSVWWWGTQQAWTDFNEKDQWYGVTDIGLTPDGQPSTTPVRQTAFDTGPKVTQLAGDGFYCAALREDGTVWEFGNVPRLSFYNQKIPYNISCFRQQPLQVTNLPSNVTSIRAADSYALALTEDGNVYAWGYLCYRLDALGPWDEWSSPTPVLLPELTNIVKIDLCGDVAMALDKNGHVWAWGYGGEGQLGVDPSQGVFYLTHPQRVFGIENATDVFSGGAYGFAMGSLDDGRPTALVGTPLNHAVRLDWRAFPGASYYNIYRADQQGGSAVATNRSTLNTFIDSGLSNRVTYFYTVSAMVNGAETPPSDEVAVRPTDPPAQPDAPVVTASCRSIHLSWNAVDNAQQYHIYRAQSANGPFLFVASTAGLTNTDQPTPSDATNYYCIAAANTAGEGQYSPLSIPVQLDSGLCMPAPRITNLKVTYAGQVNVSWTPVGLTNGTTITSPDAYRVQWYYNLHDKSPNATRVFTWTDVATNDYYLTQPDPTSEQPSYSYPVGGSDTTASALPDDHLVWFKVAAVFNGEPGADSAVVGPLLPNVVSDTNSLQAPTGLFAVPGCSQIYLQWNADPTVAYYEIQFRTNSADNNWLSAGQTVENRFWHTNLDYRTNYEYQVRSMTPVDVFDSTSNIDNIVSCPSPYCSSVTTNPVAPSVCSLLPSCSFTAKADPLNNMVYVHWESLTNQPPLRCFVERKLAAGSDDFATITETGFGLAYLDQDVLNGNTYTYRVTALDSNYNRFQSVVSATPTNSGLLNLVAVPGNAHVALTWTAFNAQQYLVKHSLSPGGPYDVLATVPSGNTYRHDGAQNGVKHYYVVTAVMPYNVSLDSPEVSAVPLATLSPLPPATLTAQNGLSTNGTPQLIFFWATSAGAMSYSLNGAAGLLVYQGPGTSAIWPVPPSATNGQPFTFQVTAFSSSGAPSDPTTTTVMYNEQTNGPADQVVLSIGGHDVRFDGDPLNITGPTNLVLHASVLAPDANEGTVYFYDGQNLIGSAQAPSAQITWFQVPQGLHYVTAQVVAQPSSAVDNLLGSSSAGATYNSHACALTVSLVPDLASYQTSASDLQLPAPGLSIGLTRSYDSRNTNIAGCLGKGWNASWDQASVHLTGDLSDGWAEAGAGGLGKNLYLISDTVSHLVTVTLPDGSSASFAPQLTAPPGAPPQPDDPVSLDFTPFADGQGFLTCDGNPGALSVLSGYGNYNWTTDPLSLYADIDDTIPFAPSTFFYTGPDGTQYIFGQPSGITNVWKLSKAIDRNGNSLTYNYCTNATGLTLTDILHSNGRQVQFSYETNGADVWISVFDTAYPKGTGVDPVLRYRVHSQFLTEFHKLVTRGSGSTASLYETNQYVYGTLGPNQDRITDAYDQRGVRTLHNEYGVNIDSNPDGRLMSQADALNRTNYFRLDQNNTLAVTSTVSGSNQTVVVNHTAGGAVASVQVGNRSVTNSYDGNGNLTAQIDALGNTKTITYDSSNRPISQSDALGNTTSTDYNEFNEPTGTTDANGNASSFEYDDNGNPMVAADALGTRTETAYIAAISNAIVYVAGLPSTETKYASGVPYNIRTEYSYYGIGAGSSGFPGDLQMTVQKALVSDSTVVNNFTITNTYGYDADGNRTNETLWGTANGVTNTAIVTQYRYDSQNRLVQTIDPLGRSSTTIYNSLGKQAATIDALNRTNLFTYDAVGNLIETVYPDGTVTRTVYDEKNRALYTQERATTNSAGQTTAPATFNVYDDTGKVIRTERRSAVVLTRQVSTQAVVLSGGQTQYGMVVSDPGAFVSCTRTVYDADGRVQYSMDARGTVTESIYDAAGRRTTNRVYTAYTVTPLDTGTIAPSGAANETASGYDPNGNQVWTIDAKGHQTGYTYDAANRQVQVTFPQVSGEPGCRSRGTTYDGMGRKIRETDEVGVITAFTYDLRGFLTQVTLDYGPHGLTTSYAYDESGNLISQTDANAHTTSFEYDELGRRTKRILPDSSAETTAYSDVPETTGSSIKVQQASVTDFRSKTIVSTQDRLGRVKTKLLPAINDGETSTTVNYVYSDVGLLSRVEMFGNSVRTNYYAYDTLHRLSQKDTPEGVLAYGYTTNDAVQTIKGYRRSTVPVNGAIPTGTSPDVSLGYGYDSLGRLQSVTNNTTASPNVTTYAYDAVGNLDHFTYPNGVKHAYTYDERNRLILLALTNASNALLRSYAYGLDPTGARTNVTETETDTAGGNVVQLRAAGYEYDQDYSGTTTPPRLHRLTREDLFDGSWNTTGTITHVYDHVGNRTARYSSTFSSTPPGLVPDQAFTFDQRDQISNYSGSYDPNGNTLVDEKGDATGDLYDAENHLIGRGTGIQIAYDQDGNRVSKTVNGATTYYLLDDQNPSGYVQVLAEYSSTSSPPSRAYAWGSNLINEQLSGGAIRYYGFDGQGSVRLLTDATTAGSITDIYDYDAHGILLGGTDVTVNNYRYTGQQWDSDLSTYFLRARYYRPSTGRFWTTDTHEGDIQNPLSLHKYLYAADNPIGNMDPSGHDIEGVMVAMDLGFSLFAQIAPTTSRTFGDAVAVERQPASSFRLSPQGLQLIAGFESFSPKIYKDDAGYDTIGFGHKLTAGEHSKFAKGITRQQGLDLLRADSSSAQGAVASAVTAPLNQCENDALVSFTFNEGLKHLKGSTLLIKLNQRNYDGASDEFPRWVYAGGHQLAGLVTRRAKERILFRCELWRFRSELGFDPY